MYTTGRVLSCFVTLICLCSTLQAELQRTGSTRSPPNRVSQTPSFSSGVLSASPNSSLSTPIFSELISFNLTSTLSKQNSSKSTSTLSLTTSTSWSKTSNLSSTKPTPWPTTSTLSLNTTPRSTTSTPPFFPPLTTTVTTPTSWATTYTISHHQTKTVTEDEALNDLFYGGKGGGIVEVVADGCGTRRRGISCFLTRVRVRSETLITFVMVQGAITAIVVIIVDHKPPRPHKPPPDRTTTTTSSTTSSTTTTSTSTTTSAEAIPSSHLIFPMDGSNSGSNLLLGQMLQRASVPGTVRAIPQVNGIAFWTAEITALTALVIQKLPTVSLR